MATILSLPSDVMHYFLFHYSDLSTIINFHIISCRIWRFLFNKYFVESLARKYLNSQFICTNLKSTIQELKNVNFLLQQAIFFTESTKIISTTYLAKKNYINTIIYLRKNNQVDADMLGQFVRSRAIFKVALQPVRSSLKNEKLLLFLLSFIEPGKIRSFFSIHFNIHQRRTIYELENCHYIDKMFNNRTKEIILTIFSHLDILTNCNNASYDYEFYLNNIPQHKSLILLGIIQYYGKSSFIDL